jgi:hypothetical protein
MMADIVRPLALAGSLLGRFWPQLLLIGALGYIARDLLLNAAVAVGLQNALGGMVVLSLVVLTKLMVVVLMFGALRPGMPALASLRQEATVAGSGDRPATGDHMLAVTAAAILPFFAYYAAWGFLGDTVREYSRLALQRVPFGERLNIFNFVQSQGMVASIAACWAIRWFAKRMNARARSPYWRLLIVAADATWIFIGLYALGVWKNDLITWIGAGAILQSLNEQLPALSMAAHAADGFTPVEFRAAPLFEQLQRLFFYALLPLVWLVMAAIINGYELSAATAPLPAGTSRADTWRKWFKDFVKHFVGGYRSRYQPILTCLRLTLSTGLATLLTFVIAYRALGWIGAWLWYAATRTIGVDDLATWQVIANALAVFIGSPSDLDGGILLDAARIALLAAVLEHAVASQRTPRPAAATT